MCVLAFPVSHEVAIIFRKSIHGHPLPGEEKVVPRLVQRRRDVHLNIFFTLFSYVCLRNRATSWEPVPVGSLICFMGD